MERTYGSKYSLAQGLSRAEIAKLIRSDIKAAIAAGTLPKDLKVSVKTHEYSMGGSIDVRIKAGITAAQAFSPRGMKAKAEKTECAPHLSCGDGLKAILATLKHIQGAYNHDGSDTMTDYFDVRYYGDVALDWELSKSLADEAVLIHNVRAAKPRIVYQHAAAGCAA